MCHEELGQYDKALELTDYILDVDDSIAEAYFIRSKIYEAQGNTDEASRARAKANAINPGLSSMLEG
jgi:tetratricopeptide (TPR) repeat protein